MAKKGPKPKDLDLRILEGVDITENGCWVWRGYKMKIGGYGKIKYDGEKRLVHRMSYEVFRGVKLTPDVLVCHACDNPGCCYPLHLFTGDGFANMQDASRKGRIQHGERHWNCRLTKDQAQAIIDRYHAGETREALAEEFGIKVKHVMQIVSGYRWKNLPRPVKEKTL